MRQKVITALTIVLLACSFIVLVPSAHANPSRPLPSFNNTSYGEWDGNQKGMSSAFWTDTPGLANGEEWSRWIEIKTSNGSISAHMGIDDCGGTAHCNGCGYLQSSGVWMFFGTTHAANICQRIPSDDINTSVRFIIFENSADGSMEFTTDKSDMPCYNPTCSEYQDTGYTFYSARMNEYILATFSNTDKVFGGAWTKNAWFSTSFAWNWQKRNFDFTLAANPPQFSWGRCTLTYNPICQVPASDGSNQGGVLASCDVDPDANCIWRK